MRNFFIHFLKNALEIGLGTQFKKVAIHPDAPIPEPNPLSWDGILYTARVLRDICSAIGRDPHMYRITDEVLACGALFLELSGRAYELDDVALVEAFAIRGSQVAQSHAFKTPHGPVHAAEAVAALRGSPWMLWLAQQGWVKAYTHRSVHHYKEFTRGPLFAWFVLVEDYMPKAQRAKLRRSLETKARRDAKTDSLDTLPTKRQKRILKRLIRKAALCDTASVIAPILRTSSLPNYAHIHTLALGLRRLHTALVVLLHPLDTPHTLSFNDP